MLQDKHIRDLQLVTLRRPSLLQSALEENNRQATLFSLSSKSLSFTNQKFPQSQKRHVCICKAHSAIYSHNNVRTTRRYGRIFGHQYLIHTWTNLTKQHSRSCLLFWSDPGSTNTRIWAGTCGRLLSRAVEASASVIWRAGGSSIGSINQ